MLDLCLWFEWEGVLKGVYACLFAGSGCGRVFVVLLFSLVRMDGRTRLAAESFFLSDLDRHGNGKDLTGHLCTAFFI